MIRGAHLYYFAKDNLGSVKAVIDANSGAIAQAIHYDEFGRVLVNTNSGFQPFGFAGGHFDHETGLVRFGARDYDPEVGRWTARDPILFAGRQGNLYVYAGNNPINRIDPSGLFLPLAPAVAIAVTIFAGGVVGAVANAATTAFMDGNTSQIGTAFMTGFVSGAAAVATTVATAAGAAPTGLAVGLAIAVDVALNIALAPSSVPDGTIEQLPNGLNSITNPQPVTCP